MIVIREMVAALAGLGMAAAASANPVASPALGAPVTATGSVTISIAGLPGPMTCNVTMAGTVSSLGTAAVPGVVTFTSGTMSGIAPTPAAYCSTVASFSYPLVARTVSQDQLVFDNWKLVTSVGACSKSNVSLPWNNITASATLNFSAGFCQFTGNLYTVSNPLVVG